MERPNDPGDPHPPSGPGRDELESLLVGINHAVANTLGLGKPPEDDTVFDRLELQARRLLSVIDDARERAASARGGGATAPSTIGGLEIRSAYEDLLMSSPSTDETPQAGPMPFGSDDRERDPTAAQSFAPATTPLDDVMVDLTGSDDTQHHVSRPQPLAAVNAVVEARKREQLSRRASHRSIDPSRGPSAVATPLERLNVEFQLEIAQQGTSPLMQGTTESLPIAALFEFLSSNRKTGHLRVKTEEETFEFELLEGTVAWCATDNPPDSEWLGETLVEMGFVDRDNLERFLARHAQSPIRIGEALERERVVTPEQLREALKHQVQRRFYRAFAARDAAYGFFESAQVDLDDRIRLGVGELLLNSWWSKDESHG